MWGLGCQQACELCDTLRSLLAKYNKMVILPAVLAYPGGAPSGPWARRKATGFW